MFLARNAIFLILFLSILGCRSEDAPSSRVETGVDQPVVRLGLISDFSGIGAYWGVQSRRGMELARREIESEGGRLEVIYGDHSLKSSVALTEAQKMINLDRVDVLWVEFAPMVIAVSDLIRTAGLLFINNSAVTSVLDANPYAFKGYLDYEKGCLDIARVWRERGIERVGFLKLEAEFAEQCLQGAEQVYPKMLVAAYQSGDRVNTQILRMKSEGIEALFNPTFEADLLNTLSAMRSLSYQIPIGGSEPDIFTPQVVREYPDMLEGALSFGFPEISEQFREMFSAAFPGEVESTLQAAAASYTHGRQIWQAFSRCPERNVECVVEKLSAAPPDPTMQFLRWQDRIAVYEYRLKEWIRGGLRDIAGIERKASVEKEL